MTTDFDFIKPNVRVELAYKNNAAENNDLTFNSVIKEVKRNYILIDYLYHNNLKYIIPEGVEFAVAFHCGESGFFTGNCFILGVDETKKNGIKITFPTEIQHIQQREYARVPLRLKVEMTIFLDEFGENVNYHHLFTQDISGSGFCYHGDFPIEEHSHIKCRINLLFNKNDYVDLDLKHVYSKEIFVNEKQRFKNAFTYINIETEDRKKILREIYNYQMEIKRKRLGF